MLISILIISYNHEHYISDAINSSLNQTYRNIEIIVSDDCSTDASWDIITSLQRRHPELIKASKTNQNSGVVANTLHGLTRCKGDFVCVIGSDDFLLPNKVELQVNKIYENSELLAVFSNGYKMSEHICQLLHKPYIASLMNSHPEEIFKYLATNVNPIFTQSALIKKAILIDAIKHCMNGISDDWCYNARIFSTLTSPSQFTYIDIPTFVYRFHSNGLHANTNRQVCSKLEFIELYTPPELRRQAIRNIYYILIKDLAKSREILFAMRLWIKLIFHAPSIKAFTLLLRIPFLYSRGLHSTQPCRRPLEGLHK